MSTANVQITAIVTGSFLSGAMMSLCLITIPTILDTVSSPSHLRTQWARMYHYGHYVLPIIAVGTSLLHAYTALTKARAGLPWGLWVLAGITTVSIAPFTWSFMLGTNNELFRLEKAKDAGGIERVRRLVAKWGWLHLVRTMLPLTGLIMAVMNL